MEIDDGEITDIFLEHFGHVSLRAAGTVLGFDNLDLDRLHADLGERLSDGRPVAFHFLSDNERSLPNVVLDSRELGRFHHDLEAILARMALEGLENQLAILIALGSD